MRNCESHGSEPNPFTSESVVSPSGMRRPVLLGLAPGPCPAGAALAQGGGTSATPFVANSPHAAGSSLGGLVTLRAPAGGPWQAITAAFSDGLTPALDVALFSDNPLSGTVTDGAAVAVRQRRPRQGRRLISPSPALRSRPTSAAPPQRFAAGPARASARTRSGGKRRGRSRSRITRTPPSWTCSIRGQP
jgi:hypothetical protein